MFNFENVAIPVYALTLSDFDNLSDFVDQFCGKTEFDLILTATSVSDYWDTIRNCVSKSIEDDDELIIISSERHCFTKDYDRDTFFKSIIRSQRMGCDIFLTGTCGFNHAVPLSDNMFWIDKFENAEFIVIYRKLYEKILDNSITLPSISNCLSYLAPTIICTTPFMSGYLKKNSSIPDIEMVDNFYLESYHIAYEKLKLYSKVYVKYNIDKVK